MTSGIKVVLKAITTGNFLTNMGDGYNLVFLLDSFFNKIEFTSGHSLKTFLGVTTISLGKPTLVGQIKGGL